MVDPTGGKDPQLHPYVLIPLFSGIVAVALAASILTRDPSHPANRLLAAILGCSAYWSFLEVIWNTVDDAKLAAQLVRISSLGWMPLGALCTHLFLELSGERDSLLRRALPGLYAVTLVSIVLYITTPWGIERAIPTAWGWSYEHGPLFVFQYAPPAIFTALPLAFLWRRVYPADAPPNERRQGWLALVGISIPLTMASVTDVFLPMLDIHVPRLGSSSIALVGATVAWSIHRYGYSLLAPGAFAREILTTLRDGVVLVRADGRIRSANASFARLLDCEAGELVGRPIGELLPDLRDGPAEEASELECELVSPSGERIPVSVSYSTLRDKQGEPVGLVLSVRDLREVASLRRSLMMAGRLAAVGELAAGISHEINNPIAFVQANLTQLDRHWSELRKTCREAGCAEPLAPILDEGEELIQEALGGVARVTRIVQDVRSFSHAGEEHTELLDVHPLIEDSLRIAAPHLRYRATVQRAFGELAPVRCNPQQLRQVFLNLLINAAQAVEEGGCICICTAQEGAEAVVRVVDNGRGIAPDVIDRIFDPFFTTKRVGEGTGLGLSLSYQMVRKHGGDIQVHSELGRGSCFEVRLPTQVVEVESAEDEGDAAQRSSAETA